MQSLMDFHNREIFEGWSGDDGEGERLDGRGRWQATATEDGD
jgi:hypothetical protein